MWGSVQSELTLPWTSAHLPPESSSDEQKLVVSNSLLCWVDELSPSPVGPAPFWSAFGWLCPFSWPTAEMAANQRWWQKITRVEQQKLKIWHFSLNFCIFFSLKLWFWKLFVGTPPHFPPCSFFLLPRIQICCCVMFKATRFSPSLSLCNPTSVSRLSPPLPLRGWSDRFDLHHLRVVMIDSWSAETDGQQVSRATSVIRVLWEYSGTHWKDGGLESPIPPVLSMGGGARLEGVATESKSDPLKSGWHVSADTTCREEDDRWTPERSLAAGEFKYAEKEQWAHLQAAGCCHQVALQRYSLTSQIKSLKRSFIWH